MSKIKKSLIAGMLLLVIVLSIPIGCDVDDSTYKYTSKDMYSDEMTDVSNSESEKTVNTSTEDTTRLTDNINVLSGQNAIAITQIPEYSGTPYVVINNNIPQFSDTDLSNVSYEYYGELDRLGRCTTAYACIGKDIMPTEERGKIGSVKPTGWHTVKYDIVEGKYLYNRCHLIGYQLTGENANNKNLITGTRYMNVEGMLPFENMVEDYISETNNHVMYRVTPVFEGDNLLANGVQMEAKSVEDSGEGILFNVFCYNVQPHVTINYANGDSAEIIDETVTKPDVTSPQPDITVPQPDVTVQQNNAAATQLQPQDDGIPQQTDGSVQSKSQSDTVQVWVSATGSKYHSRNDCGNMNPDKATRMSEGDAINMGLEKCSKCW